MGSGERLALVVEGRLITQASRPEIFGTIYGREQSRSPDKLDTPIHCRREILHLDYAGYVLFLDDDPGVLYITSSRTIQGQSEQ